MRPKKKPAYRQDREFSDFQSLVRSELERECKERLKAYLASPEWTGAWDGNKEVASQFVQKFFRENAAGIIESFLGIRCAGSSSRATKTGLKDRLGAINA